MPHQVLIPYRELKARGAHTLSRTSGGWNAQGNSRDVCLSAQRATVTSNRRSTSTSPHWSPRVMPVTEKANAAFAPGKRRPPHEKRHQRRNPRGGVFDFSYQRLRPSRCI